MVGTGNLPSLAKLSGCRGRLLVYPDCRSADQYFPRRDREAGKLPINFVAQSPCFRREKMSAGKDVRGIKRVHQFQKVEMVKFVEPHRGRDELEILTRDAEVVLERLELPYRRLNIATGDLSVVACIKYDLEVWAAGSGEWLECSSCSLFRDFQARRANIRYRPTADAKPEYVYTLNGSGLALPRIIIAILENNQRGWQRGDSQGAAPIWVAWR
jgi:seryl-tRNA synthetase